jgi:predicted DNA-binding transcriptional regulator AlpA
MEVPMEYLTIKQAEARTGIARSTIIYNIKQGHLPASQFGNGGRAPYAIDPTDLDTWAAGRQGRNTTPHRAGWLSLPAAAARLGVSRQWLHFQVSTDRIEAEQRGRWWYVREETVQKQLEQN